jgi:hypothetical protein
MKYDLERIKKELSTLPEYDYSICTLGQMHHLMEKGWTGWWAPYFLPYENKSYCGLYEK